MKPVLISAFLLASFGLSSFAQDYPIQQQQGYPPPQQQQGFPPEQLENLVGPIALYPDSLLSQVLVAATYPQDIAQANQWLAQYSYLQGQERINAAQQQPWDPSVQALVAFPDVLQRLAQDPRWTADLGNAFINQQADVMSAVQVMRQRAEESGRLRSTPQQSVYADSGAIEIVPTNPEVVYVPTYNPAYIWGPPAYGYYPSLYYPSYGFGFGSGIYLGAFFGGFHGGWGWGPSWRNRTVIVNNDFFYRNRFNGYRDGRFAGGSNVWRHDAGRSFANNQNFGRSQQFGGQGFRGQQQYSQPQRGFTGNNYSQPQRGFTGNNFRSQTPQYSQPQRSFGGSNNFRSPAPTPQYSQPQRSFGGSNNFRSPAPTPQYSQPQRSFGGGSNFRSPAPTPQYSQPQRSFGGGSNFRSPAPTPQYSQPQRSFGGGNNFRSPAPQPQYSRPQFSQPQRSFGGGGNNFHSAAPAQHFEQHNSGGGDHGGGHRR